jgi:hypothetical protein
MERAVITWQTTTSYLWGMGGENDSPRGTNGSWETEQLISGRNGSREAKRVTWSQKQLTRGQKNKVEPSWLWKLLSQSRNGTQEAKTVYGWPQVKIGKKAKKGETDWKGKKMGKNRTRGLVLPGWPEGPAYRAGKWKVQGLFHRWPKQLLCSPIPENPSF